MIVLQGQGLKVSLGGREILKSVNLALNTRERVGLVGVNGSGKTTLLKCLSSALTPDEGQIAVDNFSSLECLEQLPDLDSDITAWETVMSSFAGLLDLRDQLHRLEDKISAAGSDMDKLMKQYSNLSEEYDRANGYGCENMARRILKGLGFQEEQYNQSMKDFSGGQKTRLNLGRLLALAPDILLLDEPTNHLDMDSLEWLEEHLNSYRGTILVVSHDRMFLDKIATRIIELRDGTLYSYPGNYSDYLKIKAQNDLAWEKAFEKQQEYIKQTEAYIQRFRAGIKSRQARGRQSQLERLQRIEQPYKEKNMAGWDLKMQDNSGQDVLKIENLSKSYGELLLLHQASLSINKGDKLALIGPNGCGKSTLLKIITGWHEADKGEVHIGNRVKIAYFSQEYEDLGLNNSVLDEIIINSDLKIEEARNMLARVLFRGDDVYKMVGNLSGGEKGRLSLLKVFLSEANFLILDEPTNHLDIESMQAIESMLSAFPGTILLVSHDRYLINQIAAGVVAVENHQLEYYWGNYDYYYEKRIIQQKARADVIKAQKSPEQKLREQQRQEQKEKLKRQKRLDKQLSAVEEKISQLETRKKELEVLLSDPQSYNDQLAAKRFSMEYDEIQNLLVNALEEWEKLSTLIEEQG